MPEMVNRLYAVDLSPMVSDVNPPAEPVAENRNRHPVEEHVARNQQAFANAFTVRRLGDRNIVQAPNDLYATSLQHNFIKPQFYRPNDILGDAELTDFVSFMESFRGEAAGSNEEKWGRVLHSALVIDSMQAFRSISNESLLSKWFSSTLTAIKGAIGQRGTIERKTEKRLGVGGALAYTDPVTHVASDDAAYLSYVDEVLYSGSTKTPFAGIEFKSAPLSHNRLWYAVHPAALPQTLCALAGHPDCVVGLFLCNYGFRIIWRERLAETGTVNGKPVPLFRHHTFPPIEQQHRSPHLCYCYTQDRRVDISTFDGLRYLLRVMFEFVVTALLPRNDGLLSLSPELVPLDPRNQSAVCSPERSPRQMQLDGEVSSVLQKEYLFGAKSASGNVMFFRGLYEEDESVPTETRQRE